MKLEELRADIVEMKDSVEKVIQDFTESLRSANAQGQGLERVRYDLGQIRQQALDHVEMIIRRIDQKLAEIKLAGEAVHDVEAVKEDVADVEEDLEKAVDNSAVVKVLRSGRKLSKQ